MTKTRDPSPVPRWAGVALLVLVAVAAAALAALTIGLFVPRIPRLGAYGAELAGQSFRAAPLALVLTVVAAWLWWRRRTAVRAVVAVLAVVALVGTGYLSARLVADAASEGVALEVAPLLGLDATASREPDADVVYLHDQGEDLRMALWRPPRASGPAPIVVRVHGGGWVSGSRADPRQTAHATWLADQGYLVAGVDYSLSGPDRHLWQTQEPQVACALAWLGGNAAGYGGDASRLAMTGDSAGGNIALDVAYRRDAGTLTSACTGEIPPVRAVSALYPSASPAGFHAADRTGRGLAATMTEQHTGGTPAQVPQRYAAITPGTHVTAGSAPTLIVVGTADRFVPPQGSYDLADTLAAANVPHRLVPVYRADHMIDEDTGSAGSQIWRQATLDWFRSHGVR